MDQNIDVVVIYSFRNEVENLEELYSRSCSALKDFKYKLLFIDDQSDDGSDLLLEKLASEDNNVLVLKTSVRLGQELSTLLGLSQVQAQSYIYLDCDLQDPPELFDVLLKKFKAGDVDLIHTQRTKRLGENQLKIILTKIGYLLWNMFSSGNLPFDCGDFKIISLNVRNEMIKNNHKDPFLRGLVADRKYTHHIIQYIRGSRGHGHTHYPFWGGDPFYTFIKGLYFTGDRLKYWTIVFVAIGYIFHFSLNGIILESLIFSSLFALPFIFIKVYGLIGLPSKKRIDLGSYVKKKINY